LPAFDVLYFVIHNKGFAAPGLRPAERLAQRRRGVVDEQAHFRRQIAPGRM
jgi:hypothetical protein